MSSIGKHASRVTVELTEHLAIDDYERFRDAVQPLREAGGKVAIDDFGAGYASLRHILRVRPELIKLDISLTERIDEDPIAHGLAAALVSFAEEVGVSLVAEGIGTDDQLDTMMELGFRYGQGFHFGVPAPLDETLTALSG
jgi:EAL domain-containing protein (putative c-di-GMP-specific phosphodiesterase class I)